MKGFMQKCFPIFLALLLYNPEANCHKPDLMVAPCPTEIEVEHVADLWKAFLDARQNDPTFQQQLGVFLESKEATPEARSFLLPHLNFNAQLSNTYLDDSLAGTTHFNSNNYTVNLTQPIVDASALQNLRRAKLTVQAAVALVLAQEQDLIFRTVQAYLQVLQAMEILEYTKQNLAFSNQYLAMTKERLHYNNATITDYYQAKGQQEIILAAYIEAKVNVYNRLQELSTITGVSYTKVVPINKYFPFILPVPLNLAEWVATTEAENLLLRSAQYSMLAAKKDINVFRSKFFPTLNAFGTYTNANEVSSLLPGFTPINVKTAIVGVNFDWSVIEGGLTIAQLAKAKARYEQSISAMQREYLTAVVNTKKAFREVTQGMEKVRVSRMAMHTNLKGMEYTEAGFRAGVVSIFNLLQAQERLFRSQNEYVTDFYNYVLNLVFLKQSAGILRAVDVFRLNNVLVRRPLKSSQTIADPGVVVHEVDY